MFKIWKAIKTAWHLVNHYHEDVDLIKSRIDSTNEKLDVFRGETSDRLDQFETVILHARNEIIERTTVDADISIREKAANVVVIGRYKNADYVRIFSVRNSELNYLVDALGGMEQSMLGRMRFIDAEVGLKEFVIKRSER